MAIRVSRAKARCFERKDLASLTPDQLLAEAQRLQKRCVQLRLQHNTLLADFEQQTQLVYTDALTGVHNRRGFDEELAREVLRVQRGDGIPLVLLVVDIDYFKKLNDTYGHPAGDFVLQKVGKCLQVNVRGGDYAARIGGEEFALILRQAPIDEALTIAERLRTQVAQLELKVPTKRHSVELVHITASVGLATWQSDHPTSEGESAESLLARADGALYAAKEQGRNRVVVAP